MNLQDIADLRDAVDARTGLQFQHHTFMDGTTDLKIDDMFVFRNTDKFTLTGGAKNLEEIGAFLNGILFGMDY